MHAVFVARPDEADPLGAVEFGDLSAPEPSAGEAIIELRAAALNMHDVWQLSGAGVRESDLPLVLGSDGVGMCEGREVICHAVLPDPPRSLAPGTHLLSDGGRGTLAEATVVDRSQVIEKPVWLTWEEAACLPTAWLTAWRMLVSQARVEAGMSVLIQGAGGGVATAAAALSKAMGCSVVVASRSPSKRERALAEGADAVVEPGERVPDLVDLVIDPVGAATWGHSLKALRPGGTLVVCGAATGFRAETDLARLFARQLRILGSSMGSFDELVALVSFVDQHRLRPVVDSVYDLADARSAFAAMLGGDGFGKQCVRIS